jgi:hypothetical protein
MRTRRKSVHVQSRSKHGRPNYLVQVSNSITFFPNIFYLNLVESKDAELTDAEDYCGSIPAFNKPEQP